MEQQAPPRQFGTDAEGKVIYLYTQAELDVRVVEAVRETWEKAIAIVRAHDEWVYNSAAGGEFNHFSKTRVAAALESAKAADTAGETNG